MVWWALTAAGADTFESSALLSMGRVGTASSGENAALTLNPGLLALDRRYDFQGQFRFGPSGGVAGGGNAVDARTSDKVAGGLAYTGDTANPPITEQELPGWNVPGTEIPNRKTSHDAALALAVPAFDRHLSVGVGAAGGWYHYDRGGTGWRVDANAGLGLRPFDELTIGLAARNFLPLTGEDRPAELQSGVRLDVKGGPSIEVNGGYLPQSEATVPLNAAAGLAYAAKVAAVSAGWRRDVDGSHSVGLGFALLGPGSAFEYGTLVPVTGELSLGRTVHQLTLRFSAPAPIPVPQ